MATEVAKVIADIIQTELGLADGYVMLKNEKWIMPNNQGLYVAVYYQGPEKVISTANTVQTINSVVSEVQEVTMLHLIQIDALSYDDSAMTRKEEIIMALGSIYSRQQQAENNMQIARQTEPLMPVESLEATARLKRFTTVISVTALHSKTKTAAYYDTFQTPEVYPDV